MGLIYKDTPAGFHRVLDGPLDDHEIFNSNAELIDYCSNGTAYNGQRVIVTYGDLYEQQCIIKKGRQGLGFFIIPEFPSGIELITKIEDNDTYGLICYFNDGTIYTDDKDIMLKLDDMFYFSMLPQASLLANTTTDIYYKFEIGRNENLVSEYLTSGDIFTGNGDNVFNKIKDNLIAGNLLKVYVKCTNFYRAMGV